MLGRVRERERRTAAYNLRDVVPDHSRTRADLGSKPRSVDLHHHCREPHGHVCVFNVIIRRPMGMAAAWAARQSRKYVIERIEAAQSSLSDNLFPLVVMSYDLFLSMDACRATRRQETAGITGSSTRMRRSTPLPGRTLSYSSAISGSARSLRMIRTFITKPSVSRRQSCSSSITSCLDPKHLFIWLDYTSVPQSNAHLQKMAIRSLAVYASSVAAFVVIAPTCRHNDSGDQCNAKTYQSRGWCRLEQWGASRLEQGRKFLHLQWSGRHYIGRRDNIGARSHRFRRGVAS